MQTGCPSAREALTPFPLHYGLRQPEHARLWQHEATHWTKQASRLDRDLGKERFGDAGYAMEELVAELGSAYLSADLDITATSREGHAAYIENWLQVLKND